MKYKVKLVTFIVAVMFIMGSLTAQEKYAVLITGDYAAASRSYTTLWNNGVGISGNGYSYGFDEFWNDTYLMWEMLINRGYSNENIIVLFADGEDFYKDHSWVDERYRPNDGKIVTDYDATIGNVQMVFNGLANGTHGMPQVTSNDFLFVWTFDHGTGSGGDSYLCLLDGNMSDYDFAALTDNINANKKVFWMQQCRSGGFVDNLENNNSVVLTACQPNEAAYRANNTPVIENEVRNTITYHHGEFNFHVYSSTVGETPNGDNSYNGFNYSTADVNGDEIISIYESKKWLFYHDNIPYETPMYSDLGGIATTTTFRYPTVLNNYINNLNYVAGIIGVTSNFTLNPNGSNFNFGSNSDIYFSDGAELSINSTSVTFGNGVKFNGNQTGGTVNIVNGSTVFTGSATFNNCDLIIQGNLQISGNAVFIFDAQSHIYLNGNINAAPGATLTIQGVNQNTKLIEVNKRVSISSNFAAVTIKNGKIVMNNTNAELYFPKNTQNIPNITINNIKVTSNSGSYNSHEGIDIRSNGNISIT